MEVLKAMTRRYVLGYDPGGAEANGIAIASLPPDGLVARPTLITKTCSTVREAIDWINEKTADGMIRALGIDTLTCWSLSRSGDRPADLFMRSLGNAKTQSVLSPNSLRGAMAIGGASFLVHLKDRWMRDSTEITETHPKVLYPEISGQQYDWKELQDEMINWIAGSFELETSPANDHEFDAVLSAYAALQGYLGAWTRDLHRVSDADRSDMVEYAGTTHFWWPGASLIAAELLPEKGDRNK